MTIETDLSRLTAGLDRDEVIARAARGDVKTWVLSDDEVFAVYGALTAEGRCDQHERGVPNMCDDLPIGPDSDFDSDGAVAAQMVRQQPRRTLAQVAAIRKVVERYEDHDRARWEEPEIWDAASQAYESCIEALADIYTEPTEERIGS